MAEDFTEMTPEELPEDLPDEIQESPNLPEKCLKPCQAFSMNPQKEFFDRFSDGVFEGW